MRWLAAALIVLILSAAGCAPADTLNHNIPIMSIAIMTLGGPTCHKDAKLTFHCI